MDAPAAKQRTILYYPRILINSSAWLKQALLYWDSIGSIVPANMDRIIHGDSVLSELRDAGVFHTFRPEAVFQRSQELGDQLFEEFRDTIGRHQFTTYLEKNRLDPKHYDIHSEKIPLQMTAWLEQAGWAERIDEGVWRFELHAGLLFMALLAKNMAEVPQFSTIPGTDHPLFKDLIFESRDQMDPSLSFSIEMHKLLPVPREHVSINDILRFKRARRDELLHLREEMDQYHVELKSAQTIAEVRDLTTRFSERMARRIAELTEVLKDARLPSLLGTVENLIKVDTIPLIGIFANPFQIPVELNIVGAVALGTITVSKYNLDRRNEHRRIMRDNSFSYLYHATQQGITR